MLPEKYRRLWRRRLRRRPLLPFLLAATLAVDVLLMFSPAMRSGDGTFIANAGYGVLLAQIGLAAIWAVHTSRFIPQRLVIAALWAIAVGEGFFAIPGDDFSWFAIITLIVDAVVYLVAKRIWKKPGLQSATLRFGIGNLLAWTTIAVVGISALRSVDWALVAKILLESEAWVGMLADAFLLAGTAIVVSRRRSIPSTVAIVAIGSFLLLMSRIVVSRLVKIAILYFTSHFEIHGAQYYLVESAIYVSAFAATLLIWLLGLRHSLRDNIQQKQSSVESVTTQKFEPIDLSA